MGEALFYHLTARTLEAAAPEMLEKCLERGWRVTVRAGSPERVAALNAHLWTWRDEAFLPHGEAGDGFAARQPIYLTAGPETPNAPDVLFLVDGAQAQAAEFAAFLRVATLFDGHDAAAVAQARDQWRRARDAGCACIYWAQREDGAWVKQAEAGPTGAGPTGAGPGGAGPGGAGPTGAGPTGAGPGETE
ncbi:MAG: DNA polymerase III subunit chi [Rhodobacterales bacterium CG_4_9_14_3_um_filter_71_31]|nr:MAG: DNA polymerase III subunit chi [Rhodobacterales bacterium CG_4_9_14_3_um_filter_71_31]